MTALASARAILGERAVRADDGVGQPKIATKGQGRVGASPSDDHNMDAQRSRTLDGGAVGGRDAFGRVEEGAVEIEGDETDIWHPPSISRGVNWSRAEAALSPGKAGSSATSRSG